MTGLIRQQFTGLARNMAELKDRVRTAVAGELAGVLSSAVSQLVQAVVSGRTEPVTSHPRSSRRSSPASHWEDDEDPWGRSRDPWQDDRIEREDFDDRDYRSVEAAKTNPEPSDSTAAVPLVSSAVSAGAYAACLWFVRRGSLRNAAGFGLGIGVLGLLGGPVANLAVMILATAADLLAVSDCLDQSASRLDPI